MKRVKKVFKTMRNQYEYTKNSTRVFKTRLVYELFAIGTPYGLSLTWVMF